MKLEDRIKEAESKTNTSPTESQKAAGNYKKGIVTINGFSISIENPVGSIRKGVDKDGNSWESTMVNTYGYFRNTLGKDGDPVDVFLGINMVDGNIYVIDQVEPDSRVFDEHKVMFGFNTEEEAKEAYLSNYENGWKGLGEITHISIGKFRSWVYNQAMTKKPISKMKSLVGVRAEAGDRLKVINMVCVVEEDITLGNLQKQAGDIDSFDTLAVNIASPGGSVLEGMRIMQWLYELITGGKSVITIITANAYSIASMISLVASMRLISIHGKMMVHDPLIPNLKNVNADAIEVHAKELRLLEGVMRELYMAFTGLPESKVKELMTNETYISPQEAIEYGFVDEIVTMQKKPYMMASDPKSGKIMNMSKTLNRLQRVIALVEGKKIVNQTYSPEVGEDIEIYQQNPATYSQGDRTNVEKGEFKLSDGATITVEDYVITEIKQGVEATEEVAVETEEDGTTKTAVEVVEVVEAVEETVEEVVEEAAKAEEGANEGKVPEEFMALVKAQGDKLEEISAKLEALTKGSDDSLKASKKIDEKIKSMEEVQDMAVEAIASLADNTSSSWKPEMKANNEVKATGTIFQNLLAKKNQ